MKKHFQKKNTKENNFSKTEKFFDKSELKKNNNKITSFVIFSQIIKNFEKNTF